MVNEANSSLYNLANSVQRYHIEEKLLHNKKTGKEPPHNSLSDFDLGDDKVEVILRDDFYAQVIKDLGMSKLAESAD